MTASESQSPLNILSLDGGGVRGLSSLLILRTLMQQLQLISQSETEPRPCEIFDMICGTSTGGLVALMLGRLRMSVGDAIDAYLDFSKTVFDDTNSDAILPFWRRLLAESGARRSTIYDATKLEKWAMDLAAKYGGDGQASGCLKDPGGRTGEWCRTFVVAVCQAYADAPPALFRTYATRRRPADTCMIWEAARATTAISPFFGPVKFGSPVACTYVDGSFSGSNNPSELALDEVAEIFPNREIGCLLSLGTGVPKAISATGGPAKIAEACQKLLQNCEGVHHQLRKAFQAGKEDKHGINPYFRFSVDSGLGRIKFDEWNREEEMTAITDGYMNRQDQEEETRRCVSTLRTRATEIAAKKETDDSLL